MDWNWGSEIDSKVELVPSYAIGLRVLVIDSEISSLMHTASVLEAASYKVTTTELPDVGLIWFRERKDQYNIVLADIAMEGMDIFTFIKSILITNEDIPIFVTAYNEDAAKASKVLEQGASRYIKKPIGNAHVKLLWQVALRKTSDVDPNPKDPKDNLHGKEARQDASSKRIASAEHLMHYPKGKGKPVCIKLSKQAIIDLDKEKGRGTEKEKERDVKGKGVQNDDEGKGREKRGRKSTLDNGKDKKDIDADISVEKKKRPIWDSEMYKKFLEIIQDNDDDGATAAKVPNNALTSNQAERNLQVVGGTDGVLTSSKQTPSIHGTNTMFESKLTRLRNRNIPNFGISSAMGITKYPRWNQRFNPRLLSAGILSGGRPTLQTRKSSGFNLLGVQTNGNRQLLGFGSQANRLESNMALSGFNDRFRSTYLTPQLGLNKMGKYSSFYGSNLGSTALNRERTFDPLGDAVRSARDRNLLGKVYLKVDKKPSGDANGTSPSAVNTSSSHLTSLVGDGNKKTVAALYVDNDQNYEQNTANAASTGQGKGKGKERIDTELGESFRQGYQHNAASTGQGKAKETIGTQFGGNFRQGYEHNAANIGFNNFEFHSSSSVNAPFPNFPSLLGNESQKTLAGFGSDIGQGYEQIAANSGINSLESAYVSNYVNANHLSLDHDATQFSSAPLDVYGSTRMQNPVTLPKQTGLLEDILHNVIIDTNNNVLGLNRIQVGSMGVEGDLDIFGAMATQSQMTTSIFGLNQEVDIMGAKTYQSHIGTGLYGVNQQFDTVGVVTSQAPITSSLTGLNQDLNIVGAKASQFNLTNQSQELGDINFLENFALSGPPYGTHFNESDFSIEDIFSELHDDVLGGNNMPAPWN